MIIEMNKAHRSQSRADKTAPLVSISCITFNHEGYIAQAIDSFLMQKTIFPIEILIHDDASTDNTSNIIKEYETKYPEILKPIYETVNQWSKGKRGSAVFNFPRVRGKYIALCEGDDYWTDPYKLQKQVGFLEDNSKAIMVAHRAFKVTAAGQKISIFPGIQKDLLDPKNIIENGGDYFATNSILFRRQLITNIPKWFYRFPVGDTAINNLAIQRGEIGFINEVMSAYRKGVPNSWSSTIHNPKIKIIHEYRYALAYSKLLVFETKYRPYYIKIIIIKGIKIIKHLLKITIKKIACKK
ncbi:MAG: glycosyltransferase [Pseudomonadota bacterium]